MVPADRRRSRGLRALTALLALSSLPAAANVLPSQLLVVYNSASADAVALKNSYLAAYPAIPAANVLDLNNAALLVADISYANFVSQIRDPIRNYILAAGAPEPADIVVILLIRPFPHRIQDTDNPAIGDNPSGMQAEFLPPSNGGQGDATAASVDSELTLLWQNLNSGEAGGTMDSRSDNVIVNPFHKSVSGIDAFSRANITTQRTFTNVANVAWFLDGSGMTPGDICLVTRLDGNTLADAQLEITRARNLYVNKSIVKVLLDASVATLDNAALFSPPTSDPFYAGPDYADTTMKLTMSSWNVRYDQTNTFITPALEPNPLIAYASFGGNHTQGGGEAPPGGANYIFGYNFPPGAIFNTIESYNARGLNGLGTLFNQAQVASFIAAGGTFAVGNVWEPFSVYVPDNEFIIQNMLVNGLTWAEAAWSGMPALSWQQLALGDPLAKPVIISDPALPRGDMNGDTLVNGDDIRWFLLVMNGGIVPYRAQFPLLDPRARGDFTNDYNVTPADLPDFIDALLAIP